MRLKIFTLPLLFALVACGGAGQKAGKDSSAVAKPVQKETPTEEKVNIITGSGEGLLVDVDRPATLYYGTTLHCRMEELISKSKPQLSLILSQINNHGGVMAGSLAFIYKTLPGPGELDVMVAVPVKKKFEGAETGDFYEMPAGRFYKMELSAEPGETLVQHSKMQSLLKEKSLGFQLPVLEIFTEYNNSNMAPVSRARLFYSAAR